MLLLFISMLPSGAALGFAARHMTPPARLAFTVVIEYFLTATTMLVVGLFAVLSWDSTFPDPRDALALSLTIVLLHGASGVIWPLAFSIQATPQTVPALAFDPTPAPVSADGLQSVLTRDLQRQLAGGALAPGTGAGLAIRVWKQGEARIFAYGAAKSR